MKRRGIYEGGKKFVEFLKALKIKCFSKTKKKSAILHLKKYTNSGKFGKNSQRNVWESACKNTRNVRTLCNCAFLQLKRDRRCAGCMFWCNILFK